MDIVARGQEADPRRCRPRRRGGASVTAAFVYQPPNAGVAAATHELEVVLERHPTNIEAARIMALTGYLGIDRRHDGSAVVRVERFGRDRDQILAELCDQVRRLTTAPISVV